MIQQGPQLIHDDPGIVRIASIDQHVVPYLQGVRSDVVINQMRYWMRSMWRSVCTGQQTTLLKHVSDVVLGSVDWIHPWIGHLHHRLTQALVNQLKTVSPEQQRQVHHLH